MEALTFKMYSAEFKLHFPKVKDRRQSVMEEVVVISNSWDEPVKPGDHDRKCSGHCYTSSSRATAVVLEWETVTWQMLISQNCRFIRSPGTDMEENESDVRVQTSKLSQDLVKLLQDLEISQVSQDLARCTFARSQLFRDLRKLLWDLKNFGQCQKFCEFSKFSQNLANAHLLFGFSTFIFFTTCPLLGSVGLWLQVAVNVISNFKHILLWPKQKVWKKRNVGTWSFLLYPSVATDF